MNVCKFWTTYREGREVKIPIPALTDDHLRKAHRYCKEIQAARKSHTPTSTILSTLKPSEAAKWEKILHEEIKRRGLKILNFDELAFIRQRKIKDSKKDFRKEKNRLFDNAFK